MNDFDDNGIDNEYLERNKENTKDLETKGTKETKVSMI